MLEQSSLPNGGTGLKILEGFFMNHTHHYPIALNGYRIILALLLTGSFPILNAKIEGIEQRKTTLQMASELNQYFPELQISAKQGAKTLNLTPSLVEAQALAAQTTAQIQKRSLQDVTNFFINLFGTPVKLTENLARDLYNGVVTHNPYKDKTATVRTFETFTPGPEELAFIEKRTEHILPTFNQLTGKTLDRTTMPRVGIVCSGGGFRAAMGFAGALKELDQKNDTHPSLVDTSLYITTLSGSTWAVAPWLITDKPYRDFADDFFDRASKAIIGKPLDQQLALIQPFINIIIDDFTRKIVFGDIPSVIDIYGMLLGLSLFSPAQQQNYLNITLASMIPNIANGQQPLPLFTAVTPPNQSLAYRWIEFSPFAIACYEDKWEIQAWSFGRYFENGTSRTNQPPRPLAQDMALFGSAISLSFKDIYDNVLKKLPLGPLFAPIKQVSDVPLVGSVRMFPTFINNPTYKMANVPDSTTPKRMVVDGGMSFGDPITPLLYRPIDLMIFFYLSANVLAPAPGNVLWKAERYAREHNLPFPKIDLDRAISHVFSVFDDGPESNAPIVIYLPMIKNDNFLKTFDPQANLGPVGFLNTFNFLYSKSQIDLIAGLMGQAVKDARPTITELMKTIAEHKRTRALQVRQTAQAA